MSNPYRAMCAELLLFSDEAGEICINESLWPIKSDPDCTLLQRARALLAQPEPPELTDEELWQIWDDIDTTIPDILRAAIAADRARYGHPATGPVQQFAFAQARAIAADRARRIP